MKTVSWTSQPLPPVCVAVSMATRQQETSVRCLQERVKTGGAPVCGVTTVSVRPSVLQRGTDVPDQSSRIQLFLSSAASLLPAFLPFLPSLQSSSRLKQPWFLQSTNPPPELFPFPPSLHPPSLYPSPGASLSSTFFSSENVKCQLTSLPVNVPSL